MTVAGVKRKMTTRTYTGAAGLLLGYAADRTFGDPQRWHPVAGFGQLSMALERRIYADSRARGVLHNAVLVGGSVALGAMAQKRCTGPLSRVAITAASTWVVLGGRTLEREASAVHTHLEAHDLPAARRQVGRLVGRDVHSLDESEVSRAVIESVAENTSDAVAAPLVWGGIAGVPGLLGYRAVNTLDAMVGHRSERYQNYGWASARLDDLANLPGSRLAGVLTLVARPREAQSGWRVWRRDAAAHPSPNAGVVESAFAGVLGIKLGGTNQYYGNRVEHRAIMGSGRAPEVVDIPAALDIASKVGIGAALVASVGPVVGSIVGPAMGPAMGSVVTSAVAQRRRRMQSPQ